MPTANFAARPILLTAALVLAAGPLLSGCATRGSGHAASETREVAEFDRIDVGGAFNLFVHISSGATPKIEITADDNLLSKIATRVSGTELEIEFEDMALVRPRTEITIEIWVASLKSLDVSGAAEIDVEGLDGERFELDLSGASDSNLRGEVGTFIVDISGAAELDARELRARTVELDLSGAGEAEVRASERLDVEISGAGEVGYWGSPRTINQSISGAGSLKARE